MILIGRRYSRRDTSERIGKGPWFVSQCDMVLPEGWLIAAPIEMGTQRPRMKVYVDFEESLREVVKRFYPDTVRRNVAVLRSYVELCQEEQVQPIFVVFPFARLLRDAYPEEPLAMFRLQLADFVRRYDVPILDFFDETLPDALFSDMSHLNEAGAGVVSRELEQRLIALS